MEELELKGCNKIQALGGSETYSRRYLYMSAFDIIENDMFDAVVSEEKEPPKEEQEEFIRLLAEFNNLVIQTDTDVDLIYQTYKVNSNTEMTKKQLEQAIRKMKSKLEAN